MPFVSGLQTGKFHITIVSVESKYQLSVMAFPRTVA